MQAANGYPEPVLKLRDLLNTYLDPENVATTGANPGKPANPISSTR
jgi:hypothetical protein